MTGLTLTVPRDGRAQYLRIAEAIRAAIRRGQLRPGERLPSSRELAGSLPAHRETVMNALAELVAEGWIVTEPRRAYRVCENLPDQFVLAPKPANTPTAGGTPFRWSLARDFRLEPGLPAASIRHSFRTHPDLRVFPFAEFKSCVRASLDRSRAQQFGYTDPSGHPALVRALEAYLRRVRALGERRILVTHGSQEAIHLVSQLLLSPGDRVAVEMPGYSAALAVFESAGARLAPLPVDREGIDPSDFEALARKARPKLLYLTPLHQHPTTVTLSTARRAAIYEIAARHAVAILEDDYDHEFHYRSQPLPPMASQDPCGLVIYVSSFSKILFPSARIGILGVPESLYEPLRGLRRIVSTQNEYLTQDALARWMRSGGFERHLRRMRRVYEERRDAMSAILEVERSAGREVEWSTPDGGMAVWVKFPKDGRRISAKAAQLGVSAPAEGEFLRYQGATNHLRLGFSMQTPAELRRGMVLLMTAVDGA